MGFAMRSGLECFHRSPRQPKRVHRFAVNGPFVTGGGGGTVMRIKLLKGEGFGIDPVTVYRESENRRRLALFPADERVVERDLHVNRLAVAHRAGSRLSAV